MSVHFSKSILVFTSLLFLSGCSGMFDANQHTIYQSSPMAKPGAIYGQENRTDLISKGSRPEIAETTRPIEGFEGTNFEPQITFFKPVVKQKNAIARRLSGFSLRKINDALNQHGEGERIEWYEDKTLYQLRIDTFSYADARRECKDTFIFHKPNTIEAQWKREKASFCRVEPKAPWRLFVR